MRNFISFHGPEKGIILVNELIREESTQRAEITSRIDSRSILWGEEHGWQRDNL